MKFLPLSCFWKINWEKYRTESHHGRYVIKDTKLTTDTGQFRLTAWRWYILPKLGACVLWSPRPRKTKSVKWLYILELGAWPLSVYPKTVEPLSLVYSHRQKMKISDAFRHQNWVLSLPSPRKWQVKIYQVKTSHGQIGLKIWVSTLTHPLQKMKTSLRQLQLWVRQIPP